jgi:hypothetical protein
MRSLPLVNMTDEGMVKRVRGIAYSMRVSGRAEGTADADRILCFGIGMSVDVDGYVCSRGPL